MATIEKKHEGGAKHQGGRNSELTSRIAPEEVLARSTKYLPVSLMQKSPLIRKGPVLRLMLAGR